MEKLPFEYMEDILVRIAHHSTAIEGNTLTQAETISILIRLISPLLIILISDNSY